MENAFVYLDGIRLPVRYRMGERLPANPDLPGLEPDVARFFDRLD
jgi:hypothetical protein